MYNICLDNKCYNCIYFIFLPVFIEISIFMGIYIYEVKCIYSICISTVFIGNIYSYLLGWI